MWRGCNRATLSALALGTAAISAGGCRSGEEWSRVLRGNDTLRRENAELSRQLAESSRELAHAHQQVENLQQFDSTRPIELFAPVRIELARLTGGRDFDGRPGDDGVVVYLKPIDAYGDVVKSPGRMTVQILDNSDLARPRVVHVCEFHDPTELGPLWHGKFLTYHYTLNCPFPADVQVPAQGRLLITVAFVDFLTGKEFLASREVTLSLVPERAETVGNSP